MRRRCPRRMSLTIPGRACSLTMRPFCGASYCRGCSAPPGAQPRFGDARADLVDVGHLFEFRRGARLTDFALKTWRSGFRFGRRPMVAALAERPESVTKPP